MLISCCTEARRDGRRRGWAAVALLALAWSGPLHAQEVGVVTLIEGKPRLIREASVFPVAAGLALRKGDVVEIAAAGFAQIEFANGVITALGPESALFVVEYPLGRSGRNALPQFVMMRGWVKSETPAGAEGARYASVALNAAVADGSTVFHVTPSATRLFVESGAVALAALDSSAGQTTAKPGQFISREGGGRFVVRTGTPADFVATMPRPFRDTLPPLAVRFKDKRTAPKAERDVAYDDVADLLALPTRWRGGFVHRFQGRLRDAAVRHAVDVNMVRHPEWDYVLHPEKYRPAESESSANDKYTSNRKERAP